MRLILNRCETSRLEPLNPAKMPCSIAFSHMVISRWIFPVVILLAFIILQLDNSCSHTRALDLDISSFFESTTYHNYLIHMYVSSDAT